MIGISSVSDTLLLGYALVACDQDIEFLPRQRYQSAIANTFPSHIVNCTSIMFREIMSLPNIQTFIYQQFHRLCFLARSWRG